MTTGLLIGLLVTAAAMVLFLWWTRHEVRRIDDIIDEVDRRRDEQESRE